MNNVIWDLGSFFGFFLITVDIDTTVRTEACRRCRNVLFVISQTTDLF